MWQFWHITRRRLYYVNVLLQVSSVFIAEAKTIPRRNSAPEKAYFTLYPADASSKMHVCICVRVSQSEREDLPYKIRAPDDKSGG